MEAKLAQKEAELQATSENIRVQQEALTSGVLVCGFCFCSWEPQKVSHSYDQGILNMSFRFWNDRE